MILIADGGSTKTGWTLADTAQVVKTVTTSGINPFYQETTEIFRLLNADLRPQVKEDPSHIYFYGAGCASPEKTNIVYNALHQLFPASFIFVGSDLLAAARSLCQKNPGIACILGTGSNSCFFDGIRIVHHVRPLGYILGDEGSGAVLGKKLISDILKHQLPESISELFFETYKTSAEEILDAVYRDTFPNRYLAQYTRFISENIHLPEMELLVTTGFREFIERNVLQYPQVPSMEIHFTGSIAFYFQPLLLKTLKEFGLTKGRITETPSGDLVNYHLQN